MHNKDMLGTNYTCSVCRINTYISYNHILRLYVAHFMQTFHELERKVCNIFIFSLTVSRSQLNSFK